MRDSRENPTNRPNSPPKLARKSVIPNSSFLSIVTNWFPLKNIWNEDKCFLKKNYNLIYKYKFFNQKNFKNIFSVMNTNQKYEVIQSSVIRRWHCQRG